MQNKTQTHKGAFHIFNFGLFTLILMAVPILHGTTFPQRQMTSLLLVKLELNWKALNLKTNTVLYI